MNKSVNKLIPRAIAAVGEVLAEGPAKTQVKKEYNGYVASLGASIAQSGLLPALSFYTDASDDLGDRTPGQRKNKLLKAILYVIDKDGFQEKTLLSYTIKRLDSNFKNDDASYSFANFKADKNKERQISKEIVDATLAIKLALRSFKLKEG
jgi:CRISPR-associated protein Cmr5